MMLGVSLVLGGCQTGKLVRDLTNLTVSDATKASNLRANIETLKRTNRCGRCDLKGANLRGEGLQGAHLRGDL